MAKTVKDFPKKVGKKHDLEKYTDGQIWELEQGKDFDIQVNSFVAYCHNYAIRTSKKVTTRTSGTKLYLQFKKI